MMRCLSFTPFTETPALNQIVMLCLSLALVLTVIRSCCRLATLLGPFDHRSQALAAERKWLEEYWLTPSRRL